MSKEKDIWFSTTEFPSEENLFTLGPHFSSFTQTDPKHMLFTLSRYKFAMKMLQGGGSVLELGCADGVGTVLLKERATKVLGVDFDDRTVNWAKRNLKDEKIDFLCADILTDSFGKFDTVISLDVIEHIYPEHENQFIEAVLRNLSETGICIIGTPNITAEKYASSNEQHVNLYDGVRIRESFEKYFHNVFLFGMNDEVLHTGYTDMCHYIFVLACNPKLAFNNS